MAKNDPQYDFNPDEWVTGNRIGTHRLGSNRGAYRNHYSKEQMIAYFKQVCPYEVKFVYQHVSQVTSMFSHYIHKLELSKWCDENCKHYWTDSLIIQNTTPGEYVWWFSDAQEAILFKLSHNV